MSLTTILIVLLILAIIGGVPTFGHHGYGWGPSGAFGVVLIILLVLLLTGRV